jgi:hypothetical protein
VQVGYNQANAVSFKVISLANSLYNPKWCVVIGDTTVDIFLARLGDTEVSSIVF